tara:strand:+ start:1250 stop:1438 length:189 start_codon:yes stop_codon:yes gene_type:complete
VGNGEVGSGEVGICFVRYRENPKKTYFKTISDYCFKIYKILLYIRGGGILDPHTPFPHIVII